MTQSEAYTLSDELKTKWHTVNWIQTQTQKTNSSNFTFLLSPYWHRIPFDSHDSQIALFSIDLCIHNCRKIDIFWCECENLANGCAHPMHLDAKADSWQSPNLDKQTMDQSSISSHVLVHVRMYVHTYICTNSETCQWGKIGHTKCVQLGIVV